MDYPRLPGELSRERIMEGRQSLMDEIESRARFNRANDPSTSTWSPDRHSGDPGIRERWAEYDELAAMLPVMLPAGQHPTCNCPTCRQARR